MINETIFVISGACFERWKITYGAFFLGGEILIYKLFFYLESDTIPVI